MTPAQTLLTLPTYGQYRVTILSGSEFYCHHSYFVKYRSKNAKTRISRWNRRFDGPIFFQSTVRPRPFRWCAETYAFRCGQPQQNRKTEKHIFAPIFAKIARRAKKILRAQNMARGTSFEPRMEKKSILKKLTYGGWKFKKSVFETPYLYDGSLWRPISARNNGDGPILFD